MVVGDITFGPNSIEVVAEAGGPKSSAMPFVPSPWLALKESKHRTSRTGHYLLSQVVVESVFVSFEDGFLNPGIGPKGFDRFEE